MPEPSHEERTAIQHWAMEYGFSRPTGGTREEILSRWPNPATREHLLEELLHVELTTDLAGLIEDATPLRNGLAALQTPALRRRLCQGLYSDLIDSDLRPTWELFRTAGLEPDELKLCAAQDFVALGQTVLGHYQLVERVGHGSFGVVFRGVRGDGTSVAVKTPRRHSHQMQPIVSGLLTEEIDLYRTLDTPGVPQFLESGTIEDGLPVLVMEWIDGQPLGEVLRAKSLDVLEATRLVASLAATVDALHGAGIIHRDITPRNILVGDDGRPVLIDLGVSLTEATQFDQPQKVAGTTPYMPPESLLGMFREMDGRADVWSIGAILYELLTGQPFSLSQSREEALVHAIVAPSRVVEFPDSVPVALQAICQKCLLREPNDRFNTAGELAHALRACLEPEADEAPSVKLRMLAWRFGMKFGAAVENHAYFRKHLAEQQASGNDSGNALATALGHAAGVAMGTDELQKFAAEVGLKIEPAPHKTELWNLFYRARSATLSEHGAFLCTAVQELDQSLEQTFETAAKFLKGRDARAVALLNLAARSTLAALTRESPDVLLKFLDESCVPRTLADRFLETLRNDPASESLRTELARLHQRVEKFLLRGEPDSLQE